MPENPKRHRNLRNKVISVNLKVPFCPYRTPRSHFRLRPASILKNLIITLLLRNYLLGESDDAISSESRIIIFSQKNQQQKSIPMTLAS